MLDLFAAILGPLQIPHLLPHAPLAQAPVGVAFGSKMRHGRIEHEPPQCCGDVDVLLVRNKLKRFDDHGL